MDNIPNSSDQADQASQIQADRNWWRGAKVALLVACLGVFAIFFYGAVATVFGLALFMLVPVAMGALVTYLNEFRNPNPRMSSPKVLLLCGWVCVILALIFALEGAICIVMAAPLVAAGMALGMIIIRALKPKNPAQSGQPTSRSQAAVALALALSVPVAMGVDTVKIQRDGPLPPLPASALRSVTTTVEIAATPEVVWDKVIAFSPIKPPTWSMDDILFKAGIAYPTNAKIVGEGVGAVRHCNFSTGPFVEPITRWEKPNLLAFNVTAQPEPLKELSPYDIHPAHQKGSWVSPRGQFKLTSLPNGHTRVEGTTWYTNRIQPDIYWSLWSDYIVHRIHERVLEHIKAEAEAVSVN
jgi:hypothetical protein